jgi:transcriptional antiterminator RfaH
MPLLPRETDFYPAELFLLGEDSWPWSVAHVRSRQEKSLARHLHSQEVPFYLPLQEKRRVDGTRVRSSFVPLFPGYLFFRGGNPARRSALATRLVVRLLPVTDESRLLEELAQLRRFQEAGATLVPFVPLQPGDAVRVTEGPFRDCTGVVLRSPGGPRLIVSVSILHRFVAVEFEREALSACAGSAPRVSRVRGTVA